MIPTKGGWYRIIESYGEGDVGQCISVEDGEFGRVYAEIVVKKQADGGGKSVQIWRKRATDLEEADAPDE